jgi:hypothetical protein
MPEMNVYSSDLPDFEDALVKHPPVIHCLRLSDIVVDHRLVFI